MLFCRHLLEKKIKSNFRHPLQEIKDDCLETPMSVGDLMSPMSIDKSVIEQQINMSTVASADNTLLVKSERERFYDIEEYQHDILTYLKEAEVRYFSEIYLRYK